MKIESITSALTRDDSGIWRDGQEKNLSYPEGGNDACFSVEDTSFWFTHRNICISTVVGKFPPSDAGSIFDVGGGNGIVSMALQNAGFKVVLVEPGVNGVLNAKQRGLKNIICATTESAKFKQESLPAVGAFDVVEHIQDDHAFIREIANVIKPNGRFYVTVPAYSWLWSEEDVIAGHYRRYTLRSISELLEKNGFQVEFATYFFRFLPLPIAVLRTLPFRLGIKKGVKNQGEIIQDHKSESKFTSKILNFLLASEIKNIFNNKSMRMGASCLVVAKRQK